MTQLTLDDILPFVEKPSRYLGSEINTTKKDLSRVKLRFALAFPDLYEIGTSHFGMQILYHILNAHVDIAAERVFAPAVDMEARLRKTGKPLFSLESHEPVNHFDIVGFSLLYELNYTNVLTILDLAGIPFLASERNTIHPLIIAGGPCTCNPEPVAEFFDAVVVGDGENTIMQLAETWLNWKKDAAADRESLLKLWSLIEGVYIPSFFEPGFDDNGFQTVTPRFPDYTQVQRAIVGDLDSIPFPEEPVIAYGRPVHDRLRLEVSRGCTRGCRFCQAGMIYRPVRERSPDQLMSLAARSIAATGYEDISLLSLSTGDYGCIAPLIEQLMVNFESDNIAVSLPSLRAGTLTPELMKLIKKVRKTGFTIAPEAGSQRLRDVINKNISEDEIINTVQNAFDLGWQVIKLYFMIGLPTETEKDLGAMVELVNKLRKIKSSKGRWGKINVSVATFIPKAHTPFQWAGQLSLAESRSKINWLHHQLRLPGIQFKWQNPEVSWLEGLWARGDRRLSRLLIAAYNKGCKFDGWSDQFNFPAWEAAMAENGVDPVFFTVRKRDVNEPLPWDHIDNRVDKTFLSREWQNALESKFTADCRLEDCNKCGVCDFKEIDVKTYQNFKKELFRYSGVGLEKDAPFKKLNVYFSKLDQAKYFGHLELVNIFLRALKRAQIPVKYSQGFHPKPKISFDDPLPIGIESHQEHFTLAVADFVQPDAVLQGLNTHLPQGLHIHDCRLAPLKSGAHMAKSSVYQISVPGHDFDREKLASFGCRSEAFITLSNRKGKLKKIDLKDMVVNIELTDSNHLLVALKAEPGKTVRPAEMLRHVFDLSEEEIKKARVVKLKDLLLTNDY
ncbi:MAG: TIGR03960 family B12-binding radical SAM protein [Desulfobacterales bacterium]